MGPQKESKTGSSQEFTGQHCPATRRASLSMMPRSLRKAGTIWSGAARAHGPLAHRRQCTQPAVHSAGSALSRRRMRSHRHMRLQPSSRRAQHLPWP